MSNRTLWIALGTLTLVLCRASAAGIIYVDSSAPPGGDGSSWQTAYRFLRDGLTAAGLATPDEVRIAQGTYRPDESAAAPDGTGSKSLSFGISNGDKVLGGFAGLAGPDPDARDIDAFPTILSGDLLENDDGTDASLNDNSWTVVLAYGVGPSTLLEGVTVESGHGLTENGSGGGASIAGGARIVVRMCCFRHNLAQSGGGVEVVEGSSPLFDRCLFEGNQSVVGSGGGGLGIGAASPTLLNCRITGNSAAMEGGAIRYGGGGSPLLAGCVINGNVAAKSGAVFADESLVCRNCVFYANHSSVSQSATMGSFIARNCIFWGNTANTPSVQQAQVLVPWYEYSIVEGFVSSGLAGDTPEGVSGQDPLFIDPDGPDGIAGTIDDDFHVMPDSPAIDAGSPYHLPPPGEVDIDGEPRPIGCRVDIGVDETDGWGADCNGNLLSDACEIANGAATDCDLDGVPDDCNLASGGADCDGDLVYDPCQVFDPYVAATGDLAPAPPGSVKSFVFTGLPPAGTTVTGLIELSSEMVQGMTVALGGMPVADGSFFQWNATPCPEVPDEALFEIEASLFNAMVLDGELSVEIDIQGSGAADACSGLSFVRLALSYGTASDGDCNGNGIVDVCDLDSGLSADANGDGIPDECQGGTATIFVPSALAPDLKTAVQIAQDGYQIVIADGVHAGPGWRNIDPLGKDLVIRSTGDRDSCIIELLDANRAFHLHSNESGRFVIRDLTIRNGWVGTNQFGGGILVENASPLIENVVFRGCFADRGGAVAASGSASAPTLIDCLFEDNDGGKGGAVYTQSESTTTILDCAFDANGGDHGGGVWAQAPLVAKRCTFVGNHANNNGGAAVMAAPATLDGCVLVGNKAHQSYGYGGGVQVMVAGCAIRRSTFAANTAGKSGGGIYLENNAVLTLTDSILWGNDSPGPVFNQQIGARPAAQLAPAYLCVEGWLNQYESPGTIGEGPMFADLPGPDNVVGTLDDDVHLLPGSPCLDRGNPLASWDGEVDLDGDPLVLNCRGDMGADEAVWYRDCNANGAPDACELLDGRGSDCDANGILDECESDCDADGLIDACDPPATLLSVSSPQLPAIWRGQSVDAAFSSIPIPVGPVEVAVTAKADFGNAGVSVRLDGVEIGRLFESSSSHCSDEKTQFVYIAAQTLAAALDDGTAIVQLKSLGTGSSCELGYEYVSLLYPILPPEADCDGDGLDDGCAISSGTVPDCNGNGVPDGCDLASGVLQDLDGDGVPDACESADLDGNGSVDGMDLGILLGSWGPCAGCPADFDSDGSVDAADLGILLGQWRGPAG